MADNEYSPSSPFERHVQTAIAVVLVGLVGWVGLTLQGQGIAIARMETQIIGLQAQVTALSAATADRYTSTRAATDLAVRDREIEDLRTRIRDLEKKLEKGQ